MPLEVRLLRLVEARLGKGRPHAHIEDRGGWQLAPVRDRRVEDWDQLEAILADVFYRQCAWVKGDEGAWGGGLWP
mgnify:CR=1 FL=1